MCIPFFCADYVDRFIDGLSQIDLNSSLNDSMTAVSGLNSFGGDIGSVFDPFN